MELLKKLRLNTGQPLWLINAPANCLDLFPQFTIKEKLGKEKPLPQLILFAIDSKELEHYLSLLTNYILPQTIFWIAYPKKSGAISSDLIHMSSWDIIFQSDYRPQTSASINNDWTGLRVTNAPPKKPSTYNIAPEDRKIEGIDFLKRTVKLPPDALAAVRKHTGMESFFNAMSFTHKKEHVIAILDAKKEDTRRRRIEKMLAMLEQKMHVKPAAKKSPKQ